MSRLGSADASAAIFEAVEGASSLMCDVGPCTHAARRAHDRLRTNRFALFRLSCRLQPCIAHCSDFQGCNVDAWGSPRAHCARSRFAVPDVFRIYWVMHNSSHNGVEIRITLSKVSRLRHQLTGMSPGQRTAGGDAISAVMFASMVHNYRE